MIELLECTVMPYAWGSRTAIATLQGRSSPASGPEAELWMGAHPMAPSCVVRGAERLPLGDVVAADPNGVLGESCLRALGPRLPFLLKVLAAAEPLSLQAHPTMAQARAGFDAEEQLGVARDAPTRNYRDPFHKPELIAALTPFDALCGFRSIRESLRLFDALAVAELDAVLAPLRASPDRSGLAATFRAIMTLDPDVRPKTIDALLSACRRHVDAKGPFANEAAWAVRLSSLYPGDVGIASALLLNLVHLEPGDAIYLGAGNLHAYLDGTGIEIMAASDNVLRGGLTKKHVDLDELVRVLDFVDGPVALAARTDVDEHEHVWQTPAREFRLSALTLDGSTAVERTIAGPEIWLCTEGAFALADGASELELERGVAAFVPAHTKKATVRGEGVLFRATTPAETPR